LRDSSHHVFVKNTTIDVLDMQSCVGSVQSVAMTCPAMQRSGNCDCDAQSRSIVSEGVEEGTQIPSEEGDQMPLEFAAAQACQRCNAEDPCGWPCKAGEFYCQLCWSNYNNSKVLEHTAPSSSISPGGSATRYDGLDPVPSDVDRVDTEVRVLGTCCLSVAEEQAQVSGSSPILLVMGREHGPLAEHKYGQAGAVIRASMLQQAMHGPLPAPRWGGIYVPEVLVNADGNGQCIEKPFRVSMVYATATRGNSGGASEDFCMEMKDKIRNLLRICHIHKHDHLILGAWGCGHRGGHSREVAAIFHEALFGNSDVNRLFRKVTFAIIGSEDAFAHFGEVFAQRS